MPDIRGESGFLDDFERPAETPLTGVPPGTWIAALPGITGEMRLTANVTGPPWQGSAANNPSSGPTGLDWSMWTPDTYYGNDIEVWGLPTGGEAGAALTGWRLGFFVEGTIPGGSYSGYTFLKATALGDFDIIRKYTSAAISDINGTVFSESYSPLLLFRRIGNALEAWHCTTADGTGTWTLKTAATDSSFTGPWKIAFAIEDPTSAGTGWLAVGGPPVDDMPQIYRRPNE